jgi:hypothetical protein
MLCVLVTLVASPAWAAGSAPEAPEPYPLDATPRVLDAGTKLPCESGAVELVTYRGTTLRYSSPLRVHPAFVQKLAAFEQLARDAAMQVYGRAPQRVVHLGSYNCRRMRRYDNWVSEHALGNALDVAGFDFAPVQGAGAAASLPKRLRRGFRVTMLQHWNGKQGAEKLHATFLRTLAQTLIERADVFSVVLGPAWPGHANHLHLDRAPYRVVEVFDSLDQRSGS